LDKHFPDWVLDLLNQDKKEKLFLYSQWLKTEGIKKGLIKDSVVIESLMSFKRAGANAIVTYYADKVADFLK